MSLCQECKYNLLYFFDLHSLGADGIRGKFDLVPIVEGAFEADYDYVTNLGSKAVFRNSVASLNPKGSVTF